MGPHVVGEGRALGLQRGEVMRNAVDTGLKVVHGLKVGVLSAYRSLRWPRFRGPGFLCCFEC